MKSQAEFWKNWWNEQARHAGSDYSLNRQTSVHLEDLERRAAQGFLAAVDPHSQDIVLDAGCGSGRNISILAPLVKKVVGTDYSEQMVARAQETVVREKLKNVKLMQGDVTDIQFPPDTFDKVVCASVLQYLDREDCAVALREMVRVCKPGGRLVLHLKNGRSVYGLSLKLLRPIARLLGKRMKPEYYRSLRWHEEVLGKQGCLVASQDGFGILTFVPLPASIVRSLLKWELRLSVPRFLKRFAVNCQLTIRVDKVPAS